MQQTKTLQIGNVPPCKGTTVAFQWDSPFSTDYETEISLDGKRVAAGESTGGLQLFAFHRRTDGMSIALSNPHHYDIDSTITITASSS